MKTRLKIPGLESVKLSYAWKTTCFKPAQWNRLKTTGLKSIKRREPGKCPVYVRKNESVLITACFKSVKMQQSGNRMVLSLRNGPPLITTGFKSVERGAPKNAIPYVFKMAGLWGGVCNIGRPQKMITNCTPTAGLYPGEFGIIHRCVRFLLYLRRPLLSGRGRSQ